MALHSRRKVLGGVLSTGITSLSGCLSLLSRADSSCSTGRTRHASDVSLDRAASWPMYQYDAANTGYNPEVRGPKADVEVAWRYSACNATDAGLVVSGDRVYAGDEFVNSHTGEVVRDNWDEQFTSPTVVDGTVYFTGNGVEAYDASTGTKEWTFHPNGNRGTYPPPAVTNGTVYVATGDGSVHAIDAATGDERWEFTTNDPIRTTPAVSDGVAYVVDTSNTLYAITVDTGEIRWRTTQDVDCWRAAPTVANGRIYLGSRDGDIRAVRVTDGSTDWTQVGERNRSIGESPAVTGQTVFAAGASGTVVAIDAETGNGEWRYETSPAYGFGPPVVADGVAYVGENAVNGDAGKVVALDAADGTLLWQFEAREVTFGDYDRGGIAGTPVVLDGVVYLATGGGDVYALIESE